MSASRETDRGDTIGGAREVSPARTRTIVALAAPAIAGQILQTGVIYADRVMLGHFSSGALAAMQLAGPIEWTLVSVTSAFSVGTLALVGNAVGAGDREAARRHTTIALYVAALLGALVAVVSFAIVLPFLGAFFPHASRAPGGALETTRQYLQVGLFAAPFYCIGVAGSAALSASRDTVTPLKIGIAVNIVHVGVNFLFIGTEHGGRFGLPAMGARGAGLSTALSYALEAALTLAALARRDRLATFRPLRWPFRDQAGKQALWKLRSLAAPATIERAIYHAGYMAFVWMIARLGDDAMAANQALIAIEAISFMTVDGFAIACGALVAQELGAGRKVNAVHVGWKSTALAVATLSTFGVVFFALRERLPALVVDRDDLRLVAAGAISVMACAQPFMAAGVVLGQALRGAGRTRTTLLVSIVTGFVVRLGATWLFTAHSSFGVRGVWGGSTADWVTRAIVLAWIWRRAGADR